MSWHAIASSGQGFGGDEQSQTSSGMGCGMPANVYDVPICVAHVPKNIFIYFYPKMRPDLQIFLNFLIHLSERCIVKPSNWSRFVIPCASVLQAPRESLGDQNLGRIWKRHNFGKKKSQTNMNNLSNIFRIFWFILNSPQIWRHWGGDPAPCRAIRSHRHQNPSNAFKSKDIKTISFWCRFCWLNAQNL